MTREQYSPPPEIHKEQKNRLEQLADATKKEFYDWAHPTKAERDKLIQIIVYTAAAYFALC
jgi:hypothetical protein